MSVSSASTDRYSDPQFVARYLEAEWGDILAQHATLPTSSSGLFPPTFSGFYKIVADFASDLISRQEIDPQRVGDIGCATGRFLYELSSRIGAAELFGIEPSETLSSYGRMFLAGKRIRLPLWIPFPNLPAGPTYLKVDDSFLSALNLDESTRHRFEIVTGIGEDTPRPSSYFDVLFCLNVVDRHANPKQFLKVLREFLRDDGLFILASPMHWEKDFTPREFWVNDLRELLNAAEWEEIGETNVSYPFRANSRYTPTYVSQVICMKKVKESFQ